MSHPNTRHDTAEETTRAHSKNMQATGGRDRDGHQYDIEHIDAPNGQFFVWRVTDKNGVIYPESEMVGYAVDVVTGTCQCTQFTTNYREGEGGTCKHLIWCRWEVRRAMRLLGLLQGTWKYEPVGNGSTNHRWD
jgi:hypothetical protein